MGTTWRWQPSRRKYNESPVLRRICHLEKTSRHSLCLTWENCIVIYLCRPFEMTVGALVGEGCPAFFPVKVKMLQRSMTQVCRQGEAEENGWLGGHWSNPMWSEGNKENDEGSWTDKTEINTFTKTYFLPLSDNGKSKPMWELPGRQGCHVPPRWIKAVRGLHC